MNRKPPSQHPFSIVPWQVAMDDRLTKRHLKVIIAILSFRSGSTAPLWATREQISERCGLPETRISAVTTELEELGWLKKHGAGRQAVRYEFLNPFSDDNNDQNGNRLERANNDQSGNGSQNGNSYQNGNSTVTEMVTQPLPKRSHSDTHTDINKTKIKTHEPSGDGSSDSLARNFSSLWQAYPRRAGGNPKRKAMAAYSARIREGISHDDLAAGVERYASYVRVTHGEGSRFVMQAATFLGPDERWAEDWQPPLERTDASDGRRDQNRDGAGSYERSMRKLGKWVDEQSGAHGSDGVDLGADAAALRAQVDGELRRDAEQRMDGVCVAHEP